MLDIVMCDAIYYLTYTSKITLPGAINLFTFKTIERISRQNNHTQHITGFLLFKHGHFFQYLEGDKALVTHLYQDLLKDYRHKQLKIITEGHREQPRFKKWDMYCIDIDKDVNNLSISRLFQAFTPTHWQSSEVNELITDMQTQHHKIGRAHV